MNDVVEEIFQLYEDYGAYDYIGEKVTQTNHMIQAAMVAEREGADKETILAAFLHDIGHLLGHKNKLKQMDEWGTEDHDVIGGRYLRSKGFPEKICKLVENHVNAKRYIVTINTGYYYELSEASKQTLIYQGGRMSDEELYKFDRDPLRKIYFQFRKWEEQSKELNVELNSIEMYKNLMLEVLSS